MGGRFCPPLAQSHQNFPCGYVPGLNTYRYLVCTYLMSELQVCVFKRKFTWQNRYHSTYDSAFLSQPLLSRCVDHNMLRPIRIISFSCCIYLCVWFYQFKYAKSDLYDYGDGYFWCDHCYCGLEKQTVLNHEYCCISATEGCKKASFVENDERWWCPNSTVLSKASNSCNKHCYDSNVIHLYFYVLRDRS